MAKPARITKIKPTRDGVKTGDAPSAPAVRGKSASSPGHLKKAAGVQSAKTFTKGYKKR